MRQLQIESEKVGSSVNVITSSSRKDVEKITIDTFYGEKPIDNAEIFVNSLKKTRMKHLKKV
jgi:hypothetical protein